jgi:hypothetical protein
MEKAVKAKTSWLMCPTNNISPTGLYVSANTYQILITASKFIDALNLLPNHDPAAQKKSSGQTDDPASTTAGVGSDGLVEAPEDFDALKAFSHAILEMQQVTEADETIPQDPKSAGIPVPIFEAGTDGKTPSLVEIEPLTEE